MNEQERTRLAEIDAAQSRIGQSAAEIQRDVAASAAVNEAANRAGAEDAASEATIRARQAEYRERSFATSANLARQDAVNERAAASNATFVATLVTIVAVSLALTAIGYFAWWEPAHTDSSSSTYIRTDRTTQNPTPPNVIVPPPNVNVRVVAPETKPQPQVTAPPANGPSTDTPSTAAPSTGTPAQPDPGQTQGQPSGGDNGSTPPSGADSNNR